jgi:AraC-like DNA-binding protein
MELFTIFTTAGISIAIFTILLLSTKPQLKLPEKIIIFWLTALGINQVYFLLIGIPSIDLPNWIHLTGIALVLVHTPLLFLFSKRTFSPGFVNKDIWHTLPFVVFIAAFIPLMIIKPGEIVFNKGFVWFRNPVFPFHFYGLYLALVSGIYTIAAFVNICKHKRYLSKTQSSEIRNVLNWLQHWILAAIIFFVLTYLVVELSVSYNQIESGLTFHIVSLFLSVYIFYISYWSIRKTDVFRSFNALEFNLLRNECETGLDNEDELEELVIQLKLTIESERLYLDQDISLSDLSKKIQIPAGKLSWVINKKLGKNFYDYMNEYRVREFISRLTEGSDQNLSLLGLAFDCGFRSKSTFNAFFKRLTGQTPSTFKKNLEKKSG